MNLAIRELKESILRYVDSKDEIPVEVRKMVLEEVLKNVAEQADRQILEEIRERSEKENAESV